MFQNLLLYSHTAAAEYSQCAFQEEFTVRLGVHNIPEASEIYATCTCYAGDLIIEQVKLARTVSYIYKYLLLIKKQL